VAKLIYMTIASLDGYVADEDGKFDWAIPDDELHAFVNDLERPIGTHLYGRRLYEVMIGWETMHTLPEQTPLTLDFAAIGRRPRRSSTRGPSKRSRAPGRGSSATSTPRRYGR
jgi:dihydrofolate reductase